MKRIVQKIKQKNGESIAETLVTVLIMELIFVFLAGAVVTSADINAKSDNAKVTFESEISGTPKNGSVSLINGGSPIAGSMKAIDIYETDNGYFYYEVQ